MGLENGFNVQAALSELAPTAAEATQLRGTNFIPVVSQMVEDLGGEVWLNGGALPRDEFAAWRGSLFNDLIASRRVDTGGEQPVTVDELNLLYRITEAFDVMQSLEPGDLSKTLLGIVEGGTGVGKSTVLEEVDLPVVEEHVDTNFWLASAASPDLGVAKSAAFTAQLYFMVGRLHDLAGAFNDHTNIPGKVVADRFLEGDKAYIDMRVEAGHITPAEREILNATRELLAPLVPPTENHRTVFLFCDEDQLERRIVERGREYELGGNLPNQVGMQALTMVELGISRDDIVSGGTSALNSVNGRGVIHVVDTTGRNAADVAETVQKLITL